MTIRTQLKAGGLRLNHNETLQRASERHNEKRESAANIVWMRSRQPLTRSRSDDRLALLVVRAGLRAGRRARGRH
jgi:hypothetical protein